jgi:hypothetical protein
MQSVAHASILFHISVLQAQSNNANEVRRCWIRLPRRVFSFYRRRRRPEVERREVKRG